MRHAVPRDSLQRHSYSWCLSATSRVTITFFFSISFLLELYRQFDKSRVTFYLCAARDRLLPSIYFLIWREALHSAFIHGSHAALHIVAHLSRASIAISSRSPNRVVYPQYII